MKSHRTRDWYDRVILPHVLDCACGIEPVRKQREKVVPKAEGEVLELGIGTGRNLPYYDRARVRRIVGVDPAVQMHPLAKRRARESGLDIEIVGLPAQRLPLADASFDTVVCTFTLCSIADPAAALAEVLRVMRPGGRFLFAEHGLAPDASVQRWQRKLQPYWGPIAGDCRLDVDVPSVLRAAGFDARIEARYLPGPRFASYHYWGEARSAC
jgi:ubiquinone/menaquinone biosynthesis C-methylase UbiE